MWYGWGVFGIGKGIGLGNIGASEEGSVFCTRLLDVVDLVRAESSKFEGLGTLVMCLKSQFIAILFTWVSGQISPDLFSILDFVDSLSG